MTKHRIDTRRRFLGSAAGLALVSQASGQSSGQAPTQGSGQPAAQVTKTPQLTRRTGGDLLSRMSWMNAPASEHFAEGVLSVRSRGKTDFWRKTYFGYVTDNGHFMNLPVSGEFTFQARIDGNYSALYDQAGIMVRLDEKHWMKCGTELVDDKRWASVVFTHDFSDWSTMEDLAQRGPVYWRVVRKKDSLEAQCSIDGAKFLTIRQGYFPPGVKVLVGVMCCSPEGQGFDTTFDQLMLESG